MNAEAVWVLSDSVIHELQAGSEGAIVREVFHGGALRFACRGSGTAVVADAQGTLHALTEDGQCQPVGRVEQRIECVALLSERPLEMLVGTLEARLYRVVDGVARRVESFDRLDCRKQWHTPWGGPPSVRSLATTPDGWVYADIHVGSIMRSADRGLTWEPVTPELHEDVHQVATCPSAPEAVYANTAHAVYISADRGQSWRECGEDLDYRYGRAISVHPHDPSLVLATVSDGPHGENVHGQLYRSDDCGRNWTPANGEFPDATAENINTHRVCFGPDGRAWALADGSLYLAEGRADDWRRIWDAPASADVLAISAPN